jgi:hypothetical protein
MLVKEDGSQGRQLKFLDNDQNMEFKHKVHNMIQYKMYVEASHKQGNDKLDTQIIDFFRDSNVNKLELRDKNLNEEVKQAFLFESLTSHSRLTQLVLVNCGLTNDSLEYMLGMLMKGGRNQIWHLDFSQNELT